MSHSHLIASQHLVIAITMGNLLQHSDLQIAVLAQGAFVTTNPEGSSREVLVPVTDFYLHGHPRNLPSVHFPFRPLHLFFVQEPM